VGRVANDAALYQRLVMVDERPLLVGMAVEADGVPGRVGPQLLRPERAMRAVAVVALQQPFIYTMVKRACELRSHILVAAVAQLRRLFFHQELAFLGMMGRMTIEATNAVCQVRGTVVIALFAIVLMTAQTALAGVRGRSVLKGINLCLVPATLHVLLARAVASFTTVPFHSLVRFQLPLHGGGEVSRGFKIRIDVLMTRLAGIGTHIESGIGRRNICFGLIRGFGLLCGVLFVVGLGTRNRRQHWNQYCQKVGDGETSPTLHRTPVAIAGQISTSTRIRLHPLSLEGRNNLESAAPHELSKCVSEASQPMPQEDYTIFDFLPRRIC